MPETPDFDMPRDTWAAFHDGSVTRIEGTLPGTLRLRIEIQYLREMFPTPGDAFAVTLTGCTRFSFAEYDQPPIEDLARIAALEPEILYVGGLDPLTLDCNDGTLALEYATMRVSLEDGQPVAYQELKVAWDKYWDAFEARAKRRQAADE
jgi:hypothetical protein